ncbi:MAG: sulfatase-like hydrolase/transferase, partial [Verrucomicrobia bacterium]|nr:sulfatase-like hydrolase/transferase [Verrucomicrobiota bacterium]
MNPSYVLAVLCSALLLPFSIVAEKSRPNILIVTVDDMSCDSVGVFGCQLPDTTPQIDRLAQQGLRYHYAHVQT